MAGLILPHDHGFAAHLTEKIEVCLPSSCRSLSPRLISPAGPRRDALRTHLLCSFRTSHESGASQHRDHLGESARLRLLPLTPAESSSSQAWAICVIVVAFLGKFIGAAGMAKINGYSWRESGAVGALMCELRFGAVVPLTC